jgi:hypothetical protein
MPGSLQVSYTAAVTELRQLLSDTTLHKKATQKKIIGAIDGVNVLFTTYDKRVLTTGFVTYVNGVEVDSTLVSAVEGTIEFGDAPGINSKVTASYYWQWWLDDELKTFLNKGAELTSSFSNLLPDEAYLQILPGLKTAALYFSAAFAMDSLISYLVNRRHSEEFLIEESGNDESAFSQTISAMREQSEAFWERAKWARDDFYKAQGKRESPSFGVKPGVTRQYGPKR